MVTNLIHPYVACWINEVTIGNLTQSDCEKAGNASETLIQSEISSVSLEWSLVSAIWSFGAVFMCFLAGPASNYFGPKKCMVYNAVFAVFVNSGLYLTRLVGNFWWLVVFRFLCGVNSGFNAIISPIYLHEIAPDELKGIFGACFQMSVCVGLLLAESFGLVWVLGTNELWPYTFLLSGVAPLIQICLSVFVPESPSYLARGGFTKPDLNRAVTSEVKLKGNQAETSHLSELYANRSEKTHGLIDDFRGIWNDKYTRSAAVQISVIFAASQLTGISAVFFYSITIFQSAGIPIDFAGVASLGLAIFLILGTFIALKMINKFGRLQLLNFSLVSMGLMCIIFTLLLSISDSSLIAYISMIPRVGVVYLGVW